MLDLQDFQKHKDRDAFMDILKDKVPDERLKDILNTVQYEKELLEFDKFFSYNKIS